MDTWDLIDGERKDTLSLLETLAPAQWDEQSLCSKWKVRDVVAHMILGATMSGRAAFGLLLRHGLNFNRAMARSAIDKGKADPSELLEGFTATVGTRTTAPMTKPVDNLVDLVVHGQDVRRPLAVQRAIPDERLRPSLDRLKGYGFPFGAKKRIAGLRLEAIDLNWTWGDGPAVRGPGEAILMMLAGRRVALNDLSGDGVEVLSARA